MSVLRTETKRSFLRSLWRQCPDSTDWLTALEDFQDGCLSGSVKKGRFISATSQAGHSTQYKMPSAFTLLTEEAVLDLSEELISLYGGVKASLISTGTPSPTDQQIYDGMVGNLADIDSVYTDFISYGWNRGRLL